MTRDELPLHGVHHVGGVHDLGAAPVGARHPGEHVEALLAALKRRAMPWRTIVSSPTRC